MKEALRITGVEVHEFEREIRDTGTNPVRSRYQPGTSYKQRWAAIRVLTDAGLIGEYVSQQHIVMSSLFELGQYLIGQNALERERLYNEVKRYLQQVDRIGLATVDIALWDLAGKFYDAPIYQLLGGYRKRLPVYASTSRGDENGGLDSPEAYADFAMQCKELGYRGFKIHPWMFGIAPIERHVEMVLEVRKRVGDQMDLMIDPGCEYLTFTDALKVGRACDEAGYLWYEDPMMDGGTAELGHKRLRELIKTPLLQGEHIYGLEAKTNLITSGATDIARGDVQHDGITATMKLAHVAEALGLDIEIHLGGPETRHCIAAVRNSKYYEWGLLHPKIQRRSNPMYKGDYVDGTLEGIGSDGCVGVPEGPGLGVEYDWDYLAAHRVGLQEYQ